MAVRKPGRYLAPVALIAVLVAVIVIVSGRGGGGSNHTAPPTQAAHTTATTHRPAATPTHTFYVVKSGDTLSRISQQTGVSIATLQSLNPSLSDPNALQTGEKIRLR